MINIGARKPRGLGKLALREAALLTEARDKLSKIDAVNSLFFLLSHEFLLATLSIMPENSLAGNISFPSLPLYNTYRREVNP